MNRRDAIKQTALIMGYAVSASAVSGVLSGCQTSGGGYQWTPTNLTSAQGDLVAQIAECIIPATDTPGAKDVFVHEFIDIMLGKYLKPEEAESFKKGVDEVESKAQAAHSKGFLACTDEEQNALLVQIAEETQAAVEADPSLMRNRPFFMQMKELTLLGYFTSEQVGTEVLNFDPVPGRYDGCMDLSEVGGVNWTI